MDIETDISRMFHSGVSADQIADALGLPKVSVVAILCRKGLWNTDEVAVEDPIGPAVREQVLQCYRKGYVLPVIARTTHLTKAEIWEVLLVAGEPLRRVVPGHRTLAKLARHRRDLEIVEAFKNGIGILDIAETFELSRSRCTEILNAAGVRKGGDGRGIRATYQEPEN